MNGGVKRATVCALERRCSRAGEQLIMRARPHVIDGIDKHTPQQSASSKSEPTKKAPHCGACTRTPSHSCHSTAHTHCSTTDGDERGTEFSETCKRGWGGGMEGTGGRVGGGGQDRKRSNGSLPSMAHNQGRRTVEGNACLFFTESAPYKEKHREECEYRVALTALRVPAVHFLHATSTHSSFTQLVSSGY